MESKIELRRYIEQIDQLVKEQDAIYRKAAAMYGMSNTVFGVLYTVSAIEGDCTQQEVCRRCYWAKQTVNTAIAGLVKQGYVVLEAISGTRNEKRILLTEKGRELIRNTTDQVLAAEQNAYARLSQEERESYHQIFSKLTFFLQEEIEKLETAEERFGR